MQEDGREQSSLNIKNSLWITGTKMDVLMSITESLIPGTWNVGSVPTRLYLCLPLQFGVQLVSSHQCAVN